MATYYFIKLWHEVLDDPKMGKLNDHQWRRTIEIFLIAGRNERDGLLPPIEDMAWTLRTNVNELQADLEFLAEAGIVKKLEIGWFVTNFKKRNESQSPAERERRYRDRKRNSAYYDNEDVTTRNAQSNNKTATRNTEIDSELDIELEIESTRASEDDPFFVVQQWIEKNTGLPVTPIPQEINAINEMIKLDISEDDIKDGIAFLVGINKVARSASGIFGSVKTAHAKRIQKNGKKPPAKDTKVWSEEC